MMTLVIFRQPADFCNLHVSSALGSCRVDVSILLWSVGVPRLGVIRMVGYREIYNICFLSNDNEQLYSNIKVKPLHAFVQSYRLLLLLTFLWCIHSFMLDFVCSILHFIWTHYPHNVCKSPDRYHIMRKICFIWECHLLAVLRIIFQNTWETCCHKVTMSITC